MRILAAFLITSFIMISCSFFSGKSKIKELDKEEVAKAYCKKKGWDYNKMKGDVCVVIPNDFKHIAAIGTFANDRGCMSDGYYFAGEFTSLEQVTPEALEYCGWRDQSKREQLALNWVKQVIVVWESALHTKPENFPQSSFFKPQVQTVDGKVIVKLWIREPAGMLNRADYRAEEYTFSESGKFSNKIIARKTISGDSKPIKKEPVK